MLASAFAAALLALLVLAAGAGAATLTGTPPNVQYDGAAGEVNRLTIERVGGVYRFTDASGISITAAGTCSAAANVGTCPVTGVNDLRAFTKNLNDTITVNSSVDARIGFVFIGGGDGNDTLTSNAATDTQMNGDESFGAAGNDTLIGGPGEQTLIGGGGNDTLTAGGGDDRLLIEEGNDVLNAGPGNDGMDGGFRGVADGPDVMSGGPGRDRIDLRNRLDDMVVDLDGVADDGAGCPGAGCEGDNFGTDVEEVSLGAGDDILVGSGRSESLRTEEGDDEMHGLGGSDQMQSDAGEDALFGGSGDDSLFAGDGTDATFGGPGDDSFGYEFFDDGSDRSSGGGGFDAISGFSGNSPIAVSLDGRANDGSRLAFITAPKDNVLPDIEDVRGTSGDDVLIGSRRPNELQGFDGADRLVGGGGQDGLIGGRGSDVVIGGAGTDLLDAGGGADRLRSRDGGADHVRCGSAFDRVKADRSDRLGLDCDRIAFPRRRR